MRLPLALYRNRGNSPIALRIGERPGEPPYVYAADQGETVEGPANYERAFVSAGFFLEKQLGDGELKAPQEWPGTPSQAKPVAIQAEAQQEPEGGLGVTIGAQPVTVIPDEQPTQKPPPKKRGG